MNFFPQPCPALPQSPKLRAKQGHAKSTTFAKSATQNTKLHSHFRTLRSSARFTETEQSRAAFSLTEVVIAMGVAAVAFTSIIALFPLGLNMSKESYEETQAALLAQTIFSDFKDNLTGTNTTSSGFLLQIKATNSPENFSANYTNIPYGPSTHYVAYQQTNAGDTPNQETMLRPFDHSTSPDDFYTKGTSKALVIAKINLSYCFPLNSPTTGPNRVDITIETPGNLPTEKRKQLIFSGGFQ